MSRAFLPVVLAAALAIGGCSRQESAWRGAERQDSVAAYEAYLRDYPAGAHAPEARSRLADLREQQEWDRALRFNTPEAFQRYLSGYPSGRYSQPARERLSDFLLARAPDGDAEPTVPAAEPQVRPPVAGKLVAAASRGGEFRVQLGAFGAGEEAARRAWKDLSRRHPDLLAGLTPGVDVLSKGGRNLWRLRAGPLSEARAREICAQLASRGSPCLVVGD